MGAATVILPAPRIALPSHNSRAVVVPRQIAMYLAKNLTEASLPEIGRQFGGKHHTTVMRSIAKIDEQRRTTRISTAPSTSCRRYSTDSPDRIEW
jgi:chromosomal replication initiation ATPase DnaA